MGGPSTSSVNQEAALSLGTAQGVAQRASRTEADPAHVAPKGDHDTGGSKPPPAYVGTEPGELAVHHQVRRVARADWPRLIDKHAHREAYEQTFGIRSWYGNYIAVINFVCVVSFKRFPFYVRSYDAPELRNALEYARRMVRLLFGVELRALHSDVFSTYYDYPVIAQWRTLRRVALDMQPPEMHYMSWLVESSNKHIMRVMRACFRT